MKTTVRFDNAVTKLYNAYHNGELNAMDCTMCAVGNICDNSQAWIDNIAFDSVLQRVNNFLPNLTIEKTGYSFEELIYVEQIFMFGKWKDKFYGNWSVGKDKETQFKGLCAVVDYLCELDNIPNVMDYTKLFETENEQPKYQLV